MRFIPYVILNVRTLIHWFQASEPNGLRPYLSGSQAAQGFKFSTLHQYYSSPAARYRWQNDVCVLRLEWVKADKLLCFQIEISSSHSVLEVRTSSPGLRRFPTLLTHHVSLFLSFALTPEHRRMKKGKNKAKGAEWEGILHEDPPRSLGLLLQDDERWLVSWWMFQDIIEDFSPTSLLAAQRNATQSETDVFCVITVHVNDLSADSCDAETQRWNVFPGLWVYGTCHLSLVYWNIYHGTSRNGWRGTGGIDSHYPGMDYNIHHVLILTYTCSCLFFFLTLGHLSNIGSLPWTVACG